MAKQWWRTVETWTGELSRRRKVEKGFSGLSGDLRVRGIINLSRADPSQSGEMRWVGSWEGVGSVKVSTDRGSGRGSLAHKTGIVLTIGEKGYQLQLDDDVCRDRYYRPKYSGELEGGHWREGGMDISWGFAFSPDAAWNGQPIYLPLNPYGRDWISEVVSVDLLPSLTQNEADDVHLQRWLLIPDAEDAPWPLDRLGRTDPQPPDPPSGTPPTIQQLAKGVRAAPPPKPVPVPPPPGPAPEAIDEAGMAPEVTVMIAFLVGDGERPMAHFAQHCPALQQANESEEVVLDAVSTPRAAARDLQAQLCGHCARLLASKPSSFIASSDGSFRLYEDRIEYAGEGGSDRLVMHMTELVFTRTGGFINPYGIRITNGVGSIDQTFANQEDRDEAAELLVRAGALEQ